MSNFEWRVSSSPVPYPEALAEMDRRVAAIEAGTEPELFWLLEHPPTYTAGTSASADELLNAGDIPVFETGRGGRYTYHGPGQRVIYALCDLRNRGRDVRAHVWRLEEWVIRTLAEFGIQGERREGRIGIWVPLPPSPWGGAGGGVGRNGLASTPASSAQAQPSTPPLTPPQGEGNRIAPVEEKIAAIGVRVRRWIAFHGLALNVNPDLSHFQGIVPCGLAGFGVTSMHKLGVKATMGEVDIILRKQMSEAFRAES
jgi:lipoyl(octanoyl) transferase